MKMLNVRNSQDIKLFVGVVPVVSWEGEIRPDVVIWLEPYFSIRSANSLLKDTHTHTSCLNDIFLKLKISLYIQIWLNVKILNS